MLRWLGPRKAPEPPDGQADRPPPEEEEEEDEEDERSRRGLGGGGDGVTDDPLASAFGQDFQRHRRRAGGVAENGTEQHHHQIYSVSRSVLLPRVSLLKNTATTTAGAGNTATNITNTTAINTDGAGLGTSALMGGGINPLFQDPGSPKSPKSKPQQAPARRNSPQGRNTSSSGYGSSNISLDEPYPSPSSSKLLRDDAVTILEQNPHFVKSIKIAAAASKRKPPSSSSSGTLTTIPEGKVDSPIPKPIWPPDQYDSIVDDALLLYTSLNYVPGNEKGLEYHLDVSVKELLVDLLNNINATIEGTTGRTPEEMLKMVNEKIALSIETLKISTEEEMKKLCLNLSNCKKLNSVLRAFSSGGSSTGSSRNSPEWSSSSNGRVRTLSGTETSVDDIYQVPSGSSSSGFSDFPPLPANNGGLPVFIHEDIGSVPNGLRNAMIYGTLYRACRNAGVKGQQNNREQSGGGGGNGGGVVKKSSLRAVNDNKPSVWEQYYGVKAQQDGAVGGKCPKPTDVPLFPGGRPEADFTLDVPRSELLSRRMKEDKKWRCRCRLLTSFLGLVFFLLSVMAVSLMLTRGKRMFGSMM